MNFLRQLFGVVTFLCVSGWSADAADPNTVTKDRISPSNVAGYIERATFPRLNRALDAKLDTGADSSSIGVTDVRVIRAGHEELVRFKIVGTDQSIERKLERRVRIRRAGGAREERIVVDLEVCVAGARGATPFTLSDRAAMSYPVLIGRKFLAGRLIVDAARQFARPTGCD